MAEDALRRLEARLERASVAAEKLIDEAARAAGTGSSEARRPPPAGWGAADGADGKLRADGMAGDGAPDANRRTDGMAGDLELLAQIADRLRDLIPADLQRRLAEALRELLLAVRALIDWLVERLERRRGPAAEVRDIPIL